MRQLSFLDESFVLMESPRTPEHIGPFMIYDASTAPGGRVTFDQILAGLQERLRLAACFRQKLLRVPLGLDNSYWVEDENFDLEYHVRHLALPPPGNWRQFCVQAARLHSRPLDLSRPPWELTVIDRLDSIEGLPPGCFAIVLKVHHSAIDGISGVEIITAMHEESPDARPPEGPDDWAPERPLSTLQLLARAGIHTMLSPFHASRLAMRSLPTMGAGAPRMPTMPSAPRTRFNERITAHRAFDCARADLDELRGVKAAVAGSTINDVALAVVGGGLRQYLGERGELPGRTMTAAVPISTRTPDQASTGGNQVAMMTAPLGTDIADPLERLASIQAATKASKEAQAGVAAQRWLLEVADVLPGALLGVAVRAGTRLPGRAPVFANTLVTNTPGPRHPLYFLGARLVLSTGMCPLVDGMGLAHGVSSYVDEFNFNITACREMLPDPESYVACLRGAVEELVVAGGGQPTFEMATAK